MAMDTFRAQAIAAVVGLSIVAACTSTSVPGDEATSKASAPVTVTTAAPDAGGP